MYGWWQTVSVSDLDGDGKPDLILGNLGENFYLKPSKDNPVKLFLSDFDNNGQKDKVIARTVDGKDKPVFMKGELEGEMPMLKKQNLRNADYAKKSVQELFTKEQMEKAVVSQVNYVSSCIAFNKGNGNFTVKNLPLSVQLSSVKAVLPVDINNDGAIDLVLGGNEFGFQPQLGRLDAGRGDVLINDGKGNFSVTGPAVSGIDIDGQVRTIVSIKRKNGVSILFLRNNDYPLLYQMNNNYKQLNK